jgi:hypothetical protein
MYAGKLKMDTDKWSYIGFKNKPNKKLYLISNIDEF